MTLDSIKQSIKQEPYFECEDGLLYCADCMDILPQLPEGCVDLTVTSPPYDNLRDYKGYSFDFEPLAEQLFRTTKYGGVCVWIVGDATIGGDETGTSFRQALHFKQVGFKLFDTMIYHKYGMPMRGNVKGYNQTYEYMFVLSRGEMAVANLIYDRPNATAGSCRVTTNRARSGEVQNQGLCKTNEYGRRENIWSYNNGYLQTAKDPIAFQHPAIFPEDLAKDHILSWSNPGDLVLDCFSGAGTTGKMASKNNRRFIGIEISEEYCRIAKDRIQAAQKGITVAELKRGQKVLF